MIELSGSCGPRWPTPNSWKRRQKTKAEEKDIKFNLTYKSKSK